MKSNKKTGSRAKFTGTFLSLAFISIALVLAIYVGVNRTFSWFMTGGSAPVTGMSVRTKLEQFELAVSNTEIISYTAAGDALPGGGTASSDSPVISYLKLEENGGYQKISKTDAGNPALLCELVIDHSHGLAEHQIGPGSYGQVSFDIIVKEAGDYTFDLNLNYLPLNKNSSMAPVAISDPAVFSEVQELLAGHVLLFTGKTNGCYSGHIDDMMLSVQFNTTDDCTSQADGYHYKVMFYWTWPMIYAQFSYVRDYANDSIYLYRLQSMNSLFATASERDNMFEYIQDNPSEFFKGINFENSSASNYLDIGNSAYYDNYETLSDGYNAGDQYIGDNVYYLILSVEATMVN